MVAVEIEEHLAHGETEAVIGIVGRQVAHIGAVPHLLLSDKVRLATFFDAVLGELLVGLVLLVVAVAMGEVAHSFKAPAVGHEQGIVELVAALVVVVALVTIVVDVAEGIFVFASTVVGGVFIQHRGVFAVPGDACVLGADDGNGFEEGAFAVVAAAGEERLLVGKAVAHIAVGGLPIICHIEGKAFFRDTGTGGNAVLAGIPRAIGDVHLTIGTTRSVESLQVDGAAERVAATVGDTHAALNLNALRHAAEVWHIVPEHCLALRVVQRDAVDVHIDSAGIHATDAHRGLAHLAILARYHHGGLQFEHEGDAHLGLGLIELLTVEVGGGEGRPLARTRILNEHLVQRADGVLGLGTNCPHLKTEKRCHSNDTAQRPDG